MRSVKLFGVASMTVNDDGRSAAAARRYSGRFFFVAESGVPSWSIYRDAQESLGEYSVHRASCISLHLHGCSRASII